MTGEMDDIKSVSKRPVAKRQKIEYPDSGNLNAVVWNKRSRKSRTKRISVYRRRIATNGSRRNHRKRKKHRERENQGIEKGWDGWKGAGGEETKGLGVGGEATEEKTRLHVTSSPEPIWSQSVFHYQKPHRLYTKLYIRGDPCKTHRDFTIIRIAGWRIIDHLLIHI